MLASTRALAMSAKHVHHAIRRKEHEKSARAEEGPVDLEQTEQYAIWTPRSWSDNETPPRSPAGVNVPADSSKLVEYQDAAQVPHDLLDVIERQDAVIERLTTWCQTLEDQAVTHRMKLVEHEQTQDDYNIFCSKVRKELETLKTTARRKAKEHSVEANIQYERMQAKVDARVAAWCSRHEGIANVSKRKNSPQRSVRQKAIEVQQRTNTKATGSNAKPLATRGNSKASLGSASTSRSQLNGANSAHSPRQTAATSPYKRESGSTNLCLEPKQFSNSFANSTYSDRCFERRASPDATRPSKRRGHKGSASSSQGGTRSSPSSLQTTPMSSFNSTHPDLQKTIRDAAARTLATVNSNSSLAELGSPRVVPSPWRTSSGTGQISRKTLDGNGRVVQRLVGKPSVEVIKSPARQSFSGKVEPRSTADSASLGQGLKLIPRNANPTPFSDSGERHASPTSARQPRSLVVRSAPSDQAPTQNCNGQGKNQLPDRTFARPTSPRNPFAPPQRVGLLP